MSLSAAYVAGLMDGEGYFGINSRLKKSNGRIYYASRVMLGMTTPALEVLTEMQEQWGGSLTSVRAKTATWAEAWAWTLQGPTLVSFLSDIRSDLRIKSRQADTLLELEALRASLPKHWGGSRPEWSEETLRVAAELKMKIHALNAKGPARNVEGE